MKTSVKYFGQAVGP